MNIGSKEYIYILSCVKNGGLYRYTLNQNDELEFIDKTVLDRPMYAVRENQTLYVLLREPFEISDESGLVSFGIRNGELKYKSDVISTKGVVCCHLCVNDGAVYAANYISGSIIKMPDRLVLHNGRSVNLERQTSPHAHFAGATPDGKYICAVDLGIDKIIIYNKQLNFVSEVLLKAGNGPRHIAFSDNGRYAYCANELSSTVTVLSYEDGKMQVVNEYSTLPDGYHGNNAPAAVRYHKGYVYVSNRGHNSIACLKADDNRLALTDIVDCGGASPRDFNISGERLICANEDSDNVTVFALNGGSLKKLSEISLEKPLCVVF